MKNDRFFCKECGKFFDEVRNYEERHGLDCPPYESVAVCPYCNGDDFVEFYSSVEKYEVAEKVLAAIMYLNKYYNAAKDVFGTEAKNSNLEMALENMMELLSEAFDCFDNSFQY